MTLARESTSFLPAARESSRASFFQQREASRGRYHLSHEQIVDVIEEDREVDIDQDRKKARVSAWISAFLFLVLSLVVAAYAVPRLRIPSSNMPQHHLAQLDGHLRSTLVVSREAAAPSDGTECTEDGDHDCSATRCCKQNGTRCYEKNSSWASCRVSCTAGPDLSNPDYSSSFWTCKALGPRVIGPPDTSLCSAAGEDCQWTRCCSQPGAQCLAKELYWAECATSCRDGWNCTVLGPLTPLAEPEAEEQEAVPPWVESRCAGEGDNCLKSQCCRDYGQQCYRKNSTFATCLSACGNTLLELLGANGSDWACEELGPRMATTTDTTTSTTNTTTATSTTTTSTTTTLTSFCVSVVRADSYEAGLMKAQYASGTGIFACDEFAIFSTSPLHLAPGVDGVLFEEASVGTGVSGTASNARLFVNAWNAVHAHGRWAHHDWTLKADPDTVLIPSRLRHHLAPYNGQAAFLTNCNGRVYGALEAFSRQAMKIYFKGERWSCRDWERSPWGEDLFMEKCMSYLNVTKVDSWSIVSDARCNGVNCFDPNAAAFHPFKTIEEWRGCVDQAEATSKEAQNADDGKEDVHVLEK